MRLVKAEDTSEKNVTNEHLEEWRQFLAGGPISVKILRCRDPLMWYAKKVGQFVKIQRADSEGLWAREDGEKGPLNVIRFSDVE